MNGREESFSHRPETRREYARGESITGGMIGGRKRRRRRMRGGREVEIFSPFARNQSNFMIRIHLSLVS